MFKPEGVNVAMLTPFDSRGQLNERTLRQLVEFAIQKGVNGLFPISSIGEFVHLSFEEKVRMMEIVTDQAQGRVAVMPGAADSFAEGSVHLAQEAKRLGCEAVVICPPYYYPISQEMLERHFETVSEAVDIPIILYNIPMFSSPISNDVVKRLSRRANIVGMKDSSGSMVENMHYMDKIRVAGTAEKFNFLTGREDSFFPALMAGAKGCMVASAAIIPEIIVGIYQAFLAKDYDKAREAQYSFLQLLRAMNAAPFPLGFKTALEVRGFYMGSFRQPLSEAESYNLRLVRSRIEKLMKSLLGEYKVDVEKLA
ncbi:MAG: dihydrodipicolinate synthase family protein [Desulfitobacteriaceae bacterium]